MDTFKKEYILYYRMAYSIGLWPYDKSILSKIKRIAVCVLLVSTIVIQVTKP